MAVKKNDFIEIDYTGYLKEGNIIFDTTEKSKAKEAGLEGKASEYGPLIICVGQNHILPGLDKELDGKEPRDYKIELSPENAFGKKSAKLIKMIPFASFKKQGIMPEPGMQVNVDNMIGTIRNAAGGRCLVDFNHPLSGKDVFYEIKIKRIVTDDKEKISALFKLTFNITPEIEIKETEAEVKLKNPIPAEIQGEFIKRINELVPSIKSVKITIENKEKKESGKEEDKEKEEKKESKEEKKEEVKRQ